MLILKKIYIPALLVLSFFSGCDSSNSDNEDLDSNKTVSDINETILDKNTLVKEFISLNERANYENGYIIIDGERRTLSYSGILLFQENPNEEFQESGLGIFDEENQPLLLMGTEDGIMPSFEFIQIFEKNQPIIVCTQLQVKEDKSAFIKDHQVINITAENCFYSETETVDKNISLRLTQSMLSGGTSNLEIVGDKAYLNTDYSLGDGVYISGGLGTRAYNQIFDLIQNNPEVKTIVEQKVSGSIHDDINMQTGRLIRNAKLSTHLESTSDIASGGVDLFCSGFNRTMKTGAKLGVHSWSGEDDNGEKVEAGELPVDSPLHTNQINYFTEMLGDEIGKDFYFYTINIASADNIHYMSEDDISDYSILKDSN